MALFLGIALFSGRRWRVKDMCKVSSRCVCQCVCVRDFVRCWISHRLRQPGRKALTLTWIHVRRTYENISGGHMKRTYEMETKIEICAVAVIKLHDTDVTCSENGSTALV